MGRSGTNVYVFTSCVSGVILTQRILTGPSGRTPASLGAAIRLGGRMAPFTALERAEGLATGADVVDAVDRAVVAAAGAGASADEASRSSISVLACRRPPPIPGPPLLVRVCGEA